MKRLLIRNTLIAVMVFCFTIYGNLEKSGRAVCRKLATSQRMVSHNSIFQRMYLYLITLYLTLSGFSFDPKIQQHDENLQLEKKCDTFWLADNICTMYSFAARAAYYVLTKLSPLTSSSIPHRRFPLK
jgi:hypothetical protein